MTTGYGQAREKSDTNEAKAKNTNLMSNKQCVLYYSRSPALDGLTEPEDRCQTKQGALQLFDLTMMLR